MASQALMWDRKALPKPWPSEAPLTRPAMSTTLRNAGTLLQNKKNRKIKYRVYSYNNEKLISKSAATEDQIPNFFF